MAIGFGPGTEMQKDYQRNQRLRTPRKSLQEVSAQFSGTGTETSVYDKDAIKDYMDFKFQQRLEQSKQRLKNALVFASLTGFVMVLLMIFI